MRKVQQAFLPASINSMTAKWWELWLAILFGHKRVFDCGADGTFKVSNWHGKTYLLDYMPPNPVVSRR